MVTTTETRTIYSSTITLGDTSSSNQCSSLFPIGAPIGNHPSPMNSSPFCNPFLSLCSENYISLPFGLLPQPASPEAWNVLIDKLVTNLAWQENVRMEPERFVVQQVAESPLQVAKAVISAQGHQWLGAIGCHLEGSYGKGKSRRKLLSQEILSSNEVPGWIYRDIRTTVNRGEKKMHLERHISRCPAKLLYQQDVDRIHSPSLADLKRTCCILASVAVCP